MSTKIQMQPTPELQNPFDDEAVAETASALNRLLADTFAPYLKTKGFLILLACLPSLWNAPAFAAGPIDGLWLTDDHQGVVRIGSCGPQTCGWIASVLDHGSNVPTRDLHNPDPQLRARPLVGLQTLSGFARSGVQWTGGHAYDPKSGQSYSATLSLDHDGSLRLRGCVLMICETRRWTRMR
jgi:uncharacterized protein (DUF2147 family)